MIGVYVYTADKSLHMNTAARSVETVETGVYLYLVSRVGVVPSDAH